LLEISHFCITNDIFDVVNTLKFLKMPKVGKVLARKRPILNNQNRAGKKAPCFIFLMLLFAEFVKLFS
jgi:hypothetical protein